MVGGTCEWRGISLAARCSTTAGPPWRVAVRHHAVDLDVLSASSRDLVGLGNIAKSPYPFLALLHESADWVRVSVSHRCALERFRNTLTWTSALVNDE